MTGKRRSNHEGSLFKDEAKGLWTAEIYVEGKKKRKTSKSQQVARDWLLLQRQAVKQGTFVFDESTTLSQFLDRFVTDIVKTTLKPKTISSYQFLIEKYIKPALGEYRLGQLKPHHLQKFYSERLEAGLSKRTVQYIHALLRRALNFAIKWGLLARNPTDGVQPPNPGKKAPETLSVAQLQSFLDAVKPHRWYPIYCIAIGCGLREGEILGLRKQDVDLTDGVIHVQQTVDYIAGHSVIGTPKSESSRRSVAIPDFVLAVLQEHLQTVTASEQLIFTTSNGTPISHRNLLRHFHETLEDLGIPRVTFHSLRHSFATLQLINGVNPKIVQEALGHSSITLTLDTYSHVIPSLQKEAAKKLDALFKV